MKMKRFEVQGTCKIPMAPAIRLSAAVHFISMAQRPSLACNEGIIVQYHTSTTALQTFL